MESPLPHRNLRSPSPPTNMKVEQTGTANAWMEHKEHPRLYRPTPDIYEQVSSIANLPLIRPLGLRPGKEINYLHNTSHGLSNYKTILAHQRGQLQSNNCSCCVGPSPRGPFQLCVVLQSLNSGACTNCAYNGNGIRCTLRVKNLDGTSVNPNSASRQAAIRREQTVDRTPREIINVENGVIEDPRATPKADSVTNAIPSPATSSAFVRRQAARDAESRLSHYTYQESDVGGSGIQSPDAESRIAKHGVVEGWPDIARVSAEKPQAEAPRHPSRGSFMAKRGGGKKSHTRTKSGDVESTKRSRTATLEDSDGSSDGEPVARRRKVHTSPTPEAEETPASILDPKPVPNNLALNKIPLPEKPNTAMKSLLSMTPLRTLSWRENASRNLNANHCVEAAIGYCVGDSVAPCSRCSKGCGAFDKCITVYGHFQQSCASCHYTSKASVCTFYVSGSTDRGIVRVPVVIDRETTMADKAPPKAPPRKSLPPVPPPPTLTTTNKGTSVAKKAIPPTVSKSIGEGVTKEGAPPVKKRDSHAGPNDSGPVVVKTGSSTAKGLVTSGTAKNSGATTTQAKPTAVKNHGSLPLGKNDRSVARPADSPAAEKLTPSVVPKHSNATNTLLRPPVAKQPIPTTAKNGEGAAPKPVIRSPRYLQALSEAEQMSLLEQQLEVAELKFRISVIDDVINKVVPASPTPRYSQAQHGFEAMLPVEQQMELAGYNFQLSVMQDAVANRKNV